MATGWTAIENAVILNDCGFGRGAQFVFGYAIGAFDNLQTTLDNIKNPQVCDYPVHNALSRQGQSAFMQKFAVAVF